MLFLLNHEDQVLGVSFECRFKPPFLTKVAWTIAFQCKGRRLYIPEPSVKRLPNPSQPWTVKAAREPHKRKTKTPANGSDVLDNFDDGWPGYEEFIVIYH
jgi:hypothetical protein